MNLLFDLDGTLTDPFPGITRSLIYALTELGYAAPEADALRWCIGPPLRKTLARLLQTDDETRIHTAIAKYRERFTTVGLFENEVYPGIPEALATLGARGHRLFVATSKPQVYAQRIIEHFGLNAHFSHVYGSELDGTRGDKGELIAHIIRQENLKASEVLMIGDREHDVLGALCNGIQTVGVLWGYGTEEELRNAGAARVVSETVELCGIA